MRSNSQRLKDLQRREVHRQFARWRRNGETKKKQGKELQRLIEFANSGRQMSPVASGEREDATAVRDNTSDE